MSVSKQLIHLRNVKGISQEELSSLMNVTRQAMSKRETDQSPNKRILRNSPCLPACKQKNIGTRLRDTA